MRSALDRSSSSGIASGALVRLLMTSLLLIPIAVLNSERMVNAMLPVLGTVFEWFASDFKLLQLAIDREGADRVLRATVMWKHTVTIGDHMIYPDPRGIASASTLMAHALQGPLSALLMACAWPVARMPINQTWKEGVARALILCPMSFALICIDVPVVLAGELWQLAFDALAPGTSSILVAWKDFMQGGGRYAVGLAFAITAVYGGRCITAK